MAGGVNRRSRGVRKQRVQKRKGGGGKKETARAVQV